MLELKGVGKLYGDKTIFRNISCTFTAGSVSLLIGENGAGKSTLMRIMAGFSRPSTGMVRFADNGTQLPCPPTPGYLGHATFLYPGLTALENLRFWRDAYGLRLCEDDLTAALARVELTAHAHEKAGIFSRGMAQRLNLARVLMLAPGMLLLDEPGTGLDVASLKLLHKEVRDARARGACVVMTSHDLATDAPLADRILLLESRELAFDGTPGDYDGAMHAKGENTCCA